MILKELINDEMEKQLRKIRQLAVDNHETVKRFIDAGFSYQEHMAKANEQLDVINRIFNVFQLDI